MGADAEQDGEACNDAKPNAQLCKVVGGAPYHAERLVLFLAVVNDPVGERPALVVGVGEPAALREARDDDYLPVAPLVEAILHGDLRVEDFRVVHDEPLACNTSADAQVDWGTTGEPVWPGDRETILGMISVVRDTPARRAHQNDGGKDGKESDNVGGLSHCGGAE